MTKSELPNIIFIILTTGILFSILLTSRIYIKTRLLGLPLGVLFTYYWSLHGAWFITLDDMGRDSQLSYHYLFEKLFPAYVDTYYFWAITYYTSFLFALQFSLLYFTRNLQPSNTYSPQKAPILLRHHIVMLVSSAAFVGSYAIFGGDLSNALNSGVSGYATTRSGANELFTLASILNRMTSIPLGIGIAVLFSGGNALCMKSSIIRRWYYPAYALLGASFFIYASALGNKNELLVTLIAGVLFYLSNCPEPRTMRLLFVGIFGMVFISSIDIIRGIPIQDWSHELSLSRILSAWEIPLHSNEMFGAHLSMYGVLAYEVPIQFGYSLYSVICSIIPRIFWEDRPPDIYYHYAESVRAIEGQGYAIHHATGWYLNFGFLGIIAGAIFLAYFWIYLTKLFYRQDRIRSPVYRLFSIIAPWTFTAGFPLILRAGPEAYKGIILDCFLAPLIVLFIAMVKQTYPKSGRNQLISLQSPYHQD
jgi:hypothetical protein